MRILIVEDDNQIRKYLKSALKQELYVVDTAKNGSEGLEKACDNEYNLIIMDVLMPKMNGDQVCRELRKLGINTPILILSVEGEVSDKVSLLEIGADDYLTKPFSLEELLARIKALMRRAKEVNSEIIVVDDLEVDTNKKIVKRAGKEVELTSKEFVLLEYLAKNQGSVVSRTKILEQVWDVNADLFSNSIEVHIFKLRKKIDKKGCMPLIHTVSNRGYRLGE